MFLTTANDSPAVRARYANDQMAMGFVMNLSRLWAWRPDFDSSFSNARNVLMKDSTLAPREFAVLVCATASSMGDSYCALAWGERLATQSAPDIAAGVLKGVASPTLTKRETALMNWARKVVRHPNETTADDVLALRTAGLSDKEIFEATAFAAMRLAFSTVNDALGVNPDAEIAERASSEVREAVTFGRAPDTAPVPAQRAATG